MAAKANNKKATLLVMPGNGDNWNWHIVMPGSVDCDQSIDGTVQQEPEIFVD